MNITPYDVVDFLGEHVIRLAGITPKALYPLTRPMALNNATRGAITFCRQGVPDAFGKVQQTNSEAVLVPNEEWVAGIQDKWLIVVDDPYKRFVEVCNEFFCPSELREIHETAVIGVDVTIGDWVHIGPNAVINYAVIGNNVTIQPGAVIGSDGFGFAHDNRTENGTLIRFPHYGRVIIEDDVEIGANSVIDRGTLGDTIIRKGVKIDNLVHVAHNADIGEHTALVAHSMIAGSVTIGRESWIAPHVAIRQQQTIGAHVLAGLGAVVVSDVEDGQTVIGVPAKPIGGTSTKELDLPKRIHNALVRGEFINGEYKKHDYRFIENIVYDLEHHPYKVFTRRGIGKESFEILCKRLTATGYLKSDRWKALIDD